MDVLLFKTNIDSVANEEQIAQVFDKEKRIRNWQLINDDDFTTLTVLSSGITQDKIEEMIRSIGFECEYWAD